MGAKRQFAVSLCRIQTRMGLEPLTIRIDERDQRNRNREFLAGKIGQFIERAFRWRIDNPLGLERFKPLSIVKWHWKHDWQPSWNLSSR
jgi:hypothetical protein